MGRGLIQITGRANAHTFTKWTKEHFNNAPDFEANPVEMERFPWALVGAFWYWATRNLNAIADRDNIDAVTKKINGGLNGIADRRLRLALARKAFEGGALTPMAPTPREDEAGRKTVRRGAKGDIVKALQRALGIADDGQFGLATEAAVLEFQREHGLIPDGIVGPASWRALDGLK